MRDSFNNTPITVSGPEQESPSSLSGAESLELTDEMNIDTATGDDPLPGVYPAEPTPTLSAASSLQGLNAGLAGLSAVDSVIHPEYNQSLTLNLVESLKSHRTTLQSSQGSVDHAALSHQPSSSSLGIRRRSARYNLRNLPGTTQGGVESARIKRMSTFTSGMRPAVSPSLARSGLRSQGESSLQQQRTTQSFLPLRRARTTHSDMRRPLISHRSMADDPKVPFETFKTMSSGMLENKGVSWEDVVETFNEAAPEPITIEEAKLVWNSRPEVRAPNQVEDQYVSDLEDYNLEIHCCGTDDSEVEPSGNDDESDGESGGGDSDDDTNDDTNDDSDDGSDDPQASKSNEGKVGGAASQFKSSTPEGHGAEEAMDYHHTEQQEVKPKVSTPSRALKMYSAVQEEWMTKVVPTVVGDAKEPKAGGWKRLQELFFNEFHEIKAEASLRARWRAILKAHGQDPTIIDKQ